MHGIGENGEFYRENIRYWGVNIFIKIIVDKLYRMGYISIMTMYFYKGCNIRATYPQR